MRHVASGTHPVDLTGGRMVAPGEVVDIDPTDGHHQTLIAAGLLVALPDPPPPPPPAASPSKGRRRTKPDPEED